MIAFIAFAMMFGISLSTFGDSNVRPERNTTNKVNYFEVRKKSDSARMRVEAFGLVLKTEIDHSHYVVHWGLAESLHSDGNAKNEFEDALRDLKLALEDEESALHEIFGLPKNKNEVIFAADILARKELVRFTLDSFGNLPSFNAESEWALRSHAVITLPEACSNCAAGVFIVKTEHFDPSHFDWDIQSLREIVKPFIHPIETPPPIQPRAMPETGPKLGTVPTADVGREMNGAATSGNSPLPEAGSATKPQSLIQPQSQQSVGPQSDKQVQPVAPLAS